MTVTERETTERDVAKSSFEYLQALSERFITMELDDNTQVEIEPTYNRSPYNVYIDIKDIFGATTITFQIPSREYKLDPVVYINLRDKEKSLMKFEEVFGIRLPTTYHSEANEWYLGVSGNPAHDILVKLAKKIRDSLPNPNFGK